MFKTKDVEQTVAEITNGAISDDEQLRAFHARLVTTLKLPVLGLLGGRRVQIVTVEYLGNPRRGITLRAFEGDRTVTASILDLALPGKSAGALTLAGLKRWAAIPDEETARHAIEPTQGEVVAAYVAKVGSMHVRLRVLGSPQEITYRSSGSETLRLVPGHVVRVTTNKRWTHRGAPYMSGAIIETRVHAAALGLPPLALREEGSWDPAKEQPFAHEGALAELWREVAARPRTVYEMQQVLPGADPDEPWIDPVLRAAELHDGGETEEARNVLMSLLHRDLRCLDAHAHLGNWSFSESSLDTALAHYEVGVQIGEQSMGAAFDGVLPWGHLDNRPFLRCLNGYALALWRKQRFEEALAAFKWLLRLNPADNQDASVNWLAVRDGGLWDQDNDEHVFA